MAKKTFKNVRLVNRDNPESNIVYYTKKPLRKQGIKNLELKKYDPFLRKHCVFVEKRMPSHTK